MEGKLTQFDEDEQESVVAFFSKNLSSPEKNHRANNRELMTIICFLARFHC